MRQFILVYFLLLFQVLSRASCCVLLQEPSWAFLHTRLIYCALISSIVVHYWHSLKHQCALGNDAWKIQFTDAHVLLFSESSVQPTLSLG